MATRLKTSFKNIDNITYVVEIHDKLYTATSHTIKYGLLYNWYAATDERNICAEGWEVPEQSDCVSLRTYLGGVLIAGGKLKENELAYWLTPNTGADNSANYNARGAGYRGGGSFVGLKNECRLLTRSDSGSLAILSVLYYNNSQFVTGGSASKDLGGSLRLIKTTTALTHGQTGTYTGNDGKVYRTICIGTQEWLADNLAETKYRNGDTIPEVTDNAAWAALETGALCAYNNDWTNAYETTTVDGTPIDYIAGGDGFNITYEGEDAMNAPIISSQVTLPILMQDEYRTVINDLITDIANNGDENRFTVVIYADTALYWRGKIQAERINIPDQYTALITLQANDGFGRLKDIPYDNAGTLYEGAQSFRGHIYNILSKLDLWSYGGIDNMFNVAINYKVADIPLQRIFENLRFDHDAVKDIKQDGTILPLSCYDVLIQILTVMHCRIVQQSGVFFIQNIRYLADSGTKSYGRYDNDGNWIETIPAATFDTTIVQKLAGGSAFFRAPASTVTMQYSYKDALNGGNLFLGLTPRITNVNLGDIPTGNGEQVVFDLQFDVQHTGFSGSSMIFYIKFTFRIYSGTYYLSNSTGEMAWTTNSADRVNIVSHYEIDDALSLREIRAIQIVVPELPAPGTLNYYWDWAPSDYIGNSVTPLGTTAVATAANSASIIYAIGEANEGTIVTTASGGNTSGEKIELPTVVIGDLPFLRSIGRIQYHAGGVWYNTENVWGYGVNESLWIDQLVTRDTLALQRTATRINSYILKQSFPGCASKIGGDVVMRAEFIANAGQWMIEAFTPSIDTDGITWIDYVESGQTGGLPEGIAPTPPAPTPNFWKRTWAELTPATAGDNVYVLKSDGTAIFGESETSSGVAGLSDSGLGMYAESKSGKGLQGVSDTSIGIDGYSSSGIGVFGRSEGAEAGVYGSSKSGPGVRGDSAVFGALGSGDYVEIDINGHMKFNGAATVWDDVRVPANDLTTAGANDPSKVNWLGSLITWAFDQSTMNQLFFEVQIPHGYKEGSNIYPHVHWRPLASAASATRVRWGLEYVWQNVGEAAPGATTTIYTTAQIPSENLIGYKHYKSPFAAITGTGKTISSCLSCRIFRDAANAADDFAGDAGLIEIDFHIEMDTIGSNEEYVK